MNLYLLVGFGFKVAGLLYLPACNNTKKAWSDHVLFYLVPLFHFFPFNFSSTILDFSLITLGFWNEGLSRGKDAQRVMGPTAIWHWVENGSVTRHRPIRPIHVKVLRHSHALFHTENNGSGLIHLSALLFLKETAHLLTSQLSMESGLSARFCGDYSQNDV